MADQVNHPRHYNARKDGIECIDIIRHYTCDIANALKYLWRAGIKVEMGKPNREKEIEDLYKAIWYINDYLSNASERQCTITFDEDMAGYIFCTTGHGVKDITAPYDDNISTAIEHLLFVGLIHKGHILHICDWKNRLQYAQEYIMKRIKILEISNY